MTGPAHALRRSANGARTARIARRGSILAMVVVITLIASGAWAYWSATSVSGGHGAAAATSVNAGVAPTTTAAGTEVTVSWPAVTLANGQPVTGYELRRYDASTSASQAVLAGCAGILTAASCVESGVPNGSWKYAVVPVFAANWRGAESPKSATVVVEIDSAPPTNQLSLTSVVGGAHLSGTTVYYRGAAAGSFHIRNAVADAGSGPASSATGALTGPAAGWTHAPSTVSIPAGGPFTSAPFTWAAGASASPSVQVTGRDVAGNTAVTTVNFVDDSTPPSGAAISYGDGTASGRSVSIAFSAGNDAGSGIDTFRLQRAAAPLTGGSCGTFGTYIAIGPASPAAPYVDEGLGSSCYRYRLVVTDNVGNKAIATSPSVVRVGYAAAVNSTPGLLSYWRLGEAAEPVTIEDAFTGPNNGQLDNHVSSTGTTWTKLAGTTTALIYTNRVRRGTTASGAPYVVYYASNAPSSADYSVQATLSVRSTLTDDRVGVIGRVNTSGAFYLARWERANTSWNIYRCDSATNCTNLAALTNQGALTVNQNYRLRFDLIGNSLKLYVNGVLKVSATDGTLAAAGRAGFMDGHAAGSGSLQKGATTGIHLDDFQVTPSSYTKATDDRGLNHGDYMNGVNFGVAGAIGDDPNTAAQFDGVNDYVQVTGATGIPLGSAARSVEAWFKTTSSARQVIFDYGNLGNGQEFGLWINSGGGGFTAWGWGAGYDVGFTAPAPVNDGQWHQVVVTFSSGVLTLYIDGVALPAQSTSRITTMDAHGFGIGAVINPDDINSGGFFDGFIDEVSLYGTALSPATVAAHYELGNAPAMDTSGPSGGHVTVTGLGGTGGSYATSTTLSLSLATGTDPSGITPSGHELSRAAAPLTDGVCGTFGSYDLLVEDPDTTHTDDVSDGACYRYRYVVSDGLGFPTVYVSNEVKVDVAPPSAPTLTFSNMTNMYWPGSGTTVYARTGISAGSVRVTATSTAPSGIASYAWPYLGSGWTGSSVGLGVTIYSWGGPSTPATPGAKSVTAWSNAGHPSAPAPFTIESDNTAPAGSSISYLDAVTNNPSITVTHTLGTDSQSGIGTVELQRSQVPIGSGAMCGGNFSGYATIATDPAASYVDSTVTPNHCYRYRLVVSDNVGNQEFVAGTALTRVLPGYATLVANTSGLVDWWRLNQAGPNFPAFDSAGNNNNGTFHGGATFGVSGAIVGDSNTSILLDGVNDYVSAQRTVSMNFSIEFWFRSTAGLGSGLSWLNGAGLVATGGGSNSDFGVSLRADGAIMAGIGTGTTMVTSSGFNDGQWHHVVFVRNRGSRVLQLWVDGALRASASGASNANLNGSSVINIGRINGGNYFAGGIDEVALYNVPLTGDVIVEHYVAGMLD